MAERITVLQVWKLHLQCCEALASSKKVHRVHALAAVRDVLGAELTRILSPVIDEDEDREKASDG